MNKILLSLALGSLALGQAWASTSFGYTTEAVSRTNTFRLGSSTSQGLAIRLPHEKLQMLKGQTISGIRTAFGSKNSTNGEATLFIAEDPMTPLVSETVTISGINKFIDYTLSNPYVITGEEQELYIGYTLEIGAQYGPLSADFTQDTEGVSYALGTDGWQDLYGKGYGCANIEAVFSDDLSINDGMLKTFALGGYNKAEIPVDYQVQLLNLGTTTLTSFDVEVQVGESSPVVFPYTGQSVAPHAALDLTLPQIAASKDGRQSISINLKNLNGESDAETTDNLVTSSAYFYPGDMEKNVLLEFFTGQTCSNCPAGHSNMQSAISQAGVPVVELTHHSGYVEDIFSMNEDWDVVALYNSSTYAPAGMLNRAILNDNFAPVFDVNSISGDVKALKAANEVEPYVSLALDAPYDAATKTVNFTTRIYAHTLPNDSKAELHYTLYLVQDSIVAYQSAGGSNYVHNAVCRGCITEGSWGEKIDLAEGQMLTLQKSFELPDTIASTYYSHADGKNHIPTDFSHMKVVALVHLYSATGIAHNRVLNSAEVSLGQSYTQGGFKEKASPARKMLRQTWYGDAQGYEKATTPTRTLDYCYDSEGHLIRGVETSKCVGQDSWVLTHYYLYQYNEDGQISRTWSLQYGAFDYGDLAFYPANDTISYEYNEAGQLVKEKHPLSYYLYSYDAEGRRVEKSTWNISNITYKAKNDLVQTFSDFNADGNPQKVVATSPSGKSWNEYTGTYEYDELGHLIAERHYNADDGLLCYAEYWDYEGNFLKAHRLPVVWGDGTEETGESENYEMVDGNPDLVRHSSSTGGTSCIDQYSVIDPATAPELEVTAAEDALNSFDVTLTLPIGCDSVTLFRDGIMVDVPALSESHLSLRDCDLTNGSYEYMAVCNGTSSNLVSVKAHVDLPKVSNLRFKSTRKDLFGNSFITVTWDNPERDVRLCFERNDLLLANMQQAESSTTDPDASALEINLGAAESASCYILSVYKYGKVASQQVTVDLNGNGIAQILGEAPEDELIIYSLDGRKVLSCKASEFDPASLPKGQTYIVKGSKYCISK